MFALRTPLSQWQVSIHLIEGAVLSLVTWYARGLCYQACYFPVVLPQVSNCQFLRVTDSTDLACFVRIGTFLDPLWSLAHFFNMWRNTNSPTWKGPNVQIRAELAKVIQICARELSMFSLYSRPRVDHLDDFQDPATPRLLDITHSQPRDFSLDPRRP